MRIDLTDMAATQDVVVKIGDFEITIRKATVGIGYKIAEEAISYAGNRARNLAVSMAEAKDVNAATVFNRAYNAQRSCANNAQRILKEHDETSAKNQPALDEALMIAENALAHDLEAVMIKPYIDDDGVYFVASLDCAIVLSDCVTNGLANAGMGYKVRYTTHAATGTISVCINNIKRL